MHILLAYICTHNAFHSRYHIFYSYTRVEHSNVVLFIPNKENLEETFCPLFTASSKIHSVVNFLRKHCWASHVWKRIERTWSGLTVRGQNKHLAGRLEASSAAFYILHWFLQPGGFSTHCLKYNLDRSHFQGIH